MALYRLPAHWNEWVARRNYIDHLWGEMEEEKRKPRRNRWEAKKIVTNIQEMILEEAGVVQIRRFSHQWSHCGSCGHYGHYKKECHDDNEDISGLCFR